LLLGAIGLFKFPSGVGKGGAGSLLTVSGTEDVGNDAASGVAGGEPDRSAEGADGSGDAEGKSFMETPVCS
jgi:hypothetical protein